MIIQADLNIADSLMENVPGLIWIKDRNKEYVTCNERFKNFAHFPSIDYLVGKNDFNLPWANYADPYRDGDTQILEGQTLTFLHPIRRYNGDELIITSRKSPIKDSNGKINGILGCVSIITSPHAVHNIHEIAQYDLRWIDTNENNNQYIISDNFDCFGLSKCEATCLFYLIRGKTAKEIGIILANSTRTIEKHIDSIKVKLNCKTKSDMISKALLHGFMSFIPSDFHMF